MQIALSGTWAQVTISISNDSNHYTTNIYFERTCELINIIERLIFMSLSQKVNANTTNIKQKFH